MPADSTDSTYPTKLSFLPELALLTTVTIWGSGFIVSKEIFTQVEVMAFIFVRFGLMIGMALAILAVIHLRDPSTLVKPRRADVARFTLAGLAGFTVYQLGYNLGLDRTSVFAASLLVSSSPLFTILILTLLGERPPTVAWIGVTIAIFGVAIFLLDKRGGERSTTGDLLCILGAASFALYGIVNRPLVADYPPATYTAWNLLLGGVPLLLIGLPAAIEQDWGAPTSRSWLAILCMVIFPVYIAYMFLNYGIAERGAAVATSFTLLVPIIAGVLSAVFYDETFGVQKLLGAALVLGGLLIIRVGPRLIEHFGVAKSADSAG